MLQQRYERPVSDWSKLRAPRRRLVRLCGFQKKWVRMIHETNQQRADNEHEYIAIMLMTHFVPRAKSIRVTNYTRVLYIICYRYFRLLQ